MSSIIQQLKLWDQLIEQRIKFEELMHKCNSLPQEETLLKLMQLDKDGKLAKYQVLAEEHLLKLFEECAQFEKVIEKLNPNLLDKEKLGEENREDNLDEDEKMQIDENSDEEGYESEEENDEEENELSEDDSYFDSEDERPFESDEELNELNKLDNQIDLSNKLIEFNLDKTDLNKTIENTELYLSNRYARLNEVRDDILNFWFEKTRFTLKGGKLDKNSLDAFEQSTVKSINHLLLNKLKLVKRTQLKRGNYEIIGKKEQADENEPQINSELVEKKKKEIYDAEIFDDSDFYHQLLRELVNSSSNLNTVSKVNPKWLKLMRERFKSNKYVDTKATKARKIRYKVHNELVNFMTPMMHLNNYDEEQHSNLIKSIFSSSINKKQDSNLEFDDSSSSDSD